MLRVPIISRKIVDQAAMGNLLCGDQAAAEGLGSLPELVVVADLVKVVGGEGRGDGGDENRE